ncbi:hypothetical protein HYC85_024976 [Camellia sinensis]|uniref:Uncharacterized protein n=1 Tax=Camellia sinensis TaxID=4442 RepID=A0A7J7G9M2_CAMSI|nr:hypothetical protein HYC85_024976 [Camellia sinensis]
MFFFFFFFFKQQKIETLLMIMKGHVMPPPEAEKWTKKENSLLRSMKRSAVPSKGPYHPTYIPTPNIKASTISQNFFVGHVMRPPEVEKWIKKENNLLRSMKRSLVPPFGPNSPHLHSNT